MVIWRPLDFPDFIDYRDFVTDTSPMKSCGVQQIIPILTLIGSL